MAKRRVIFVHPDLGIGGAEKLVVNAAEVLQSMHDVQVSILTAHHSPNHCFNVTNPDGVLGNRVHVHGDWLPRTIGGRFHVVCAILRMAWVAMVLLCQEWWMWMTGRWTPAVIFCDQVSHVVPLLSLSGLPVLFYCHFPDKLLCVNRQSFLKRIYRAPVDWLEEKTTGASDRVVVNSGFTESVFREAFVSLSHVPVSVLYPAVEPDAVLAPLDEDRFNAAVNSLPAELSEIIRRLATNSDIERTSTAAAVDGSAFVLSINRFERKKNLRLAVKAISYVNSAVAVRGNIETESSHSVARVRLVMAGGYDERVSENVEYYMELRQEAETLGMQDDVTFVRSFTDDQKVVLLRYCTCVIYTPEREHFGIVPVEAMFAGKPVIALDSGGPKETVDHNVTGLLIAATDTDEVIAQGMAKAINSLVRSYAKTNQMGKAGQVSAAKRFSLNSFGQSLVHIVDELLNERKKTNTNRSSIVIVVVALVLAALPVVALTIMFS